MRYVENPLFTFPYGFTAMDEEGSDFHALDRDGADPRLKFCLEIQRPDTDEEEDFDADDFMLKPEVSRWLETLAKDEWEFDGFDGNISFRSKTDAMAFRMAWLA